MEKDTRIEKTTKLYLLKMPADLHKRLKIKAAEKEITLHNYIIEKISK